MPTYTYNCGNCNTSGDYVHKMGDKPDRCFSCGVPGRLERVFAGQPFSVSIPHQGGKNRQMFVETGVEKNMPGIGLMMHKTTGELAVVPVEIKAKEVRPVGGCN